jgi:hypothetical protein
VGEKNNSRDQSNDRYRNVAVGGNQFANHRNPSIAGLLPNGQHAIS